MTNNSRPNRRFPHVLGAALLLALAPAACASNPTPFAKAAAIKPSPYLVGNYLSGEHALTIGDVNTAATMLLRASEQAPDNEALRGTALVTTLRAGRIADALKLAAAVAKSDHPLDIANLTLTVDAIKAGRTAEALAHLKPIEDKGTYGYLTPLMRAWTEAGAGHEDKALKALKPLDQREGFETLVTLNRALIEDLAGDTKSAAKDFGELRKDPSRLSLRLIQLIGAFLERQGDKADARTLYLSYDTDQPGGQSIPALLAELKAGGPAPRYINTASDGAAEALAGLAGALTQQNARDTAEVFVRLALYLKPKFPTAQLLLAGLMEAAGRREDAAAVYESIPASSSLKISAMIRNADNLDRLGQTDQAIKVLREIAAARPHDPQPMMDLGDILRRHERFADAVKAYDEAVKRIGELTPRYWALLYTRGIALEQSHQWKRAEHDFLQALKFEPNQPLVLNYLGYTWVEKGVHLAEAEAMIRKAVNLRPSDGYIVDSLGWVLYRLGKTAEAVPEMERAVELRPEDPVINDHLGDVYWAVGRTREARFQWRRSLSLDPDPALAKELEKKLKDGLPPQKTIEKGGKL